MHNKPIALIILDGFGISLYHAGNAIIQAKTPHIVKWLESMPHTKLAASGEAVGLPCEYVGNSEVGHYTIGAGRIVTQPTTLINEHIHNKSLYINQLLVTALKKCLHEKKQLHIVGILSDAGIHGNQDHIIAYAHAAHANGIKKIYVHAILDGRDTLTHTAQDRIAELSDALKKYNGEIVTIHGRFFAMDRNKNYDRTLQSYHTLTNDTVPITQNWKSFLYPHNQSEEYCDPMRIVEEGYIKPGDTVLFTACRADRIQQLVLALAGDKKVLGKNNPIKKLVLLSPISYGLHIPTIALYETEPIHNTLKEALCMSDRTVFSIAETEKYAHITYFFNGEKEKVLTCEVRHLIPSLTVKDFSKYPAMKAGEITDTVLKSLTKDPKDFYLINYANADMVGHSGNLAATIQSIEVLDTELSRLYNTIVQEMDGTLFITADHGNAEQKIDPKTNAPSPTHTTNPVPFIVVTKKPLAQSLVAHMQGLADIAPMILKYMGIPTPTEMTGTDKKQVR